MDMCYSLKTLKVKEMCLLLIEEIEEISFIKSYILKRNN
jgi:hypothetical protein